MSGGALPLRILRYAAWLMKIALGIEYSGSGFSGWQHQCHATGVQTVLEHALARVADHPVQLVAAGRTDKGVHATQQIAHFSSTALRPVQAWVLGVNAQLPASVGVLWAKEVDAGFHARFSALERTYRYYILNRAIRPSLHFQRVAWVREALDFALMRQAAVPLLGEHDFTSFRASGCQSHSPVRDIRALQIERQGDLVRFIITANAFLYHMVRNIAGALIRVGTGCCPPEWIGAVLQARDRRAAGVTASPDGLYLHEICYPKSYAFPPASDPFVVF